MERAQGGRPSGLVGRVSAMAGELEAAAAPLLIFLALLVLGLWNLGGPAPWWDEGWTLSVARSAAERGFYGRMLLGEPAPPGLEAAPIVTLPVAGALRLLGVGLWQGRVYGAVCAAAAVTLLWALGERLYGRRAGWGALAAALLLSMHPQLNPLIQGRQVLGEMPMLLALLGGYACLLAALRGRWLWVAPAALLWAAALITKAQALPFWTASLAAALGAALLLRQWRAAGLVALAGAAANLGQGSLGAAVWWLMPPVVPGREELAGLMEVTAVVPRAFNRLYALEVLLLFGLPTVGALMWALWREARALPRGGGDAGAVARWALLGLAWSWLAWYALLSVGVPRYLLPVALVGALFLGALLRDLTGGLDPRATLAAMAAPLRRGGPAPATAGGRWSWAGAWLAALIVAAALPLTALSYARYYVERDHAAERVAAFLNTRTPPEAVVETYESELHFLLERPYHYPPDPVHVALNRRGLLGEAGAGVDYDPLAADPDYLVVGIFARGNDLYAPALDSGAFRSVLRDGDYEVFERVR